MILFFALNSEIKTQSKKEGAEAPSRLEDVYLRETSAASSSHPRLKAVPTGNYRRSMLTAFSGSAIHFLNFSEMRVAQTPVSSRFADEDI